MEVRPDGHLTAVAWGFQAFGAAGVASGLFAAYALWREKTALDAANAGVPLERFVTGLWQHPERSLEETVVAVAAPFVIVAALVAALAATGVVGTGRGIARRAPWARIAGLVVTALVVSQGVGFALFLGTLGRLTGPQEHGLVSRAVALLTEAVVTGFAAYAAWALATRFARGRSG